MNYLGSKYTLLPFINQVYDQVCTGKEKVFCDLFAGTGNVGRQFKKFGLRVIANDIQYYAYVLNRAYIGIAANPQFTKLYDKAGTVVKQYHASGHPPFEGVLRFLNNLRPVEGFIASTYTEHGNRRYFTVENAQKIDAIRYCIEEWWRQKWINENEYYYLLCALLEAADAVANVASVYDAFLKDYKKTALKPLLLRHPFIPKGLAGQVYNQDANVLIQQIECDVLYLDPPYNRRQYGACYHLLETIAGYDAPAVTGITGLRPYTRSRYCVKEQAEAALMELIRHAQAKRILLSYNNEGVIQPDRITAILAQRGRVRVFANEYKRFKADNQRTYSDNKTVEYLYHVSPDK